MNAPTFKLDSGAFIAIGKFIAVVILAGIMWGRSEARVQKVEDMVAALPVTDKILVEKIERLTDEVVKLRIEMATTRAELSAIKERK
jgi:hypothetical protein